MHHVKYSKLYVQQAIKQMAQMLKKEQIVNDNTIFLVMLNGGVWFSSHLFDQLGNLNNLVYYIKGHSYSSTQRESFVWDYLPDMQLEGKDVLVIDDICDSGETIKAIYNKLHDTVHSISFVTLLKRMPTTQPDFIQVYSCINDNSDKFFVGCGLDNNGTGRLLNYIGIC